MQCKKQILTECYHSPLGDLILGTYDEQLCLCDWQDAKHRMQIDRRLSQALKAEIKEGKSQTIIETIKQLDEYFSAKRQTFSLSLLLPGTALQQQVWNALLTIPFGQTISYKEIAQRIRKPRATRAVANAIGANALSIIIPCHRVIGSQHSLTGYAGGIERKKELIEWEVGVPLHEYK